MGFLSSIGKIASSVFNGIKKVASSGFGQTLIKIAGTAFGGPLGGVIASAATGLLSGKMDFKSLVRTGLNAFSPVAANIFDTVTNLPTALKNPTGLLGSLGSFGQIASSLLGGEFGEKVSNVINKVNGFLGKATGVGQKIGNIADTVKGILGDVGVRPPQFIDNFSQGLGSVLNALTKIQETLANFGNILSSTNLIRA
jgi:hypothetical protein